MKILAVCANGMGTSSIIKTKIKKITEDLGLQAEVDHASISTGKSKALGYDVIFCSNAFLVNFQDLEKRNVKVIGVRNLMSEQELREKLELYLSELPNK